MLSINGPVATSNNGVLACGGSPASSTARRVGRRPDPEARSARTCHRQARQASVTNCSQSHTYTPRTPLEPPELNTWSSPGVYENQRCWASTRSAPARSISGIVMIASQFVLGLLFDHGRQPGEVFDGRCRRVDVGHPGRVERRALAREPEQRSEVRRPIVLDSLVRPIEPRHVVLERGSYRIQVGCAQLLVGRLRVLVGHPHSVPLAP